MTANTDAPESLDGGQDARDPDPGHGRPPAGSSRLYALHSALVESEAADPARELLAAISDRIRNPLQVLLARADLMDDEEAAERIREQVRRINDAVKYLEGALSDPYSTEKKGGPALDEDIHRR